MKNRSIGDTPCSVADRLRSIHSLARGAAPTIKWSKLKQGLRRTIERSTADPAAPPLTVSRYVVGNVKRFPKILRTPLRVRASNSATHCAEWLALATKGNPEQGTRSGSACTLSGRRRGVGGWEMPFGSSVLNRELALRQLRIMPQWRVSNSHLSEM